MFSTLKALLQLPVLAGLHEDEIKRIQWIMKKVYFHELLNPKSVFSRKEIDKEYPEKRFECLFSLIPEDYINKYVQDLMDRLVWVDMHTNEIDDNRIIDYQDNINKRNLPKTANILPIENVSYTFWWS